MTTVCIAGATGWTGRAVAEAVLATDDLVLVGAVARRAAGRDLGEAWGGPPLGVSVHGTVAEALEAPASPPDVLIDYTAPEAVRDNVIAALERGVAVVIGSSGLSAAEFRDIDAIARARGVGVIAAGNFSITAAMAKAAAALVAPHLPHREIIDYAAATKPDAPSGTARELAETLALICPAVPALTPEPGTPASKARGTTVAGTQVHSVRIPSFVVSTEIVFGLEDERLVIRHDAGSTAAPYVAGTLLAVRAVGRRAGLVRGLDALLLETTSATAPLA